MLTMLSFIFIGITLLSLLLFYYCTGKDKRVLFLYFAWTLFVGIVSYSGYFTNTASTPPRFLLVLWGAICLSVLLYRTTKSNKLNTAFLLAIHTLRLPVELVLYQLFLQKKVPILMTFKGWNFDILIGISAIILLLYLLITKRKISKKITFVWNIFGIIFLIIIVLIAILSSPLQLQQLAFDQPNVAVLQFPFTYLPAIIVPLVFLSHILTIKTNRPDSINVLPPTTDYQKRAEIQN